MQDWGFWAAAVGLCLAVAAILLAALGRGGAVGTANQGLQVYKDQLAEVERDLAKGTLGADEAQRLRTEVARRILEADRTAGAAGPLSVGGPALIPAAIVVLTLAAAVAGYLRLGAPGYSDLPLQERLALADERMEDRPSQAEAVAATPEAPAPTGLAPDFLDLMVKLRAAVAERPDDLRGLELLARNEAALGNFAAAEAAQRRLIGVKGDATAADHAALAEIMIAAAGGYVSPEAEAVLVTALGRDPAAPVARYYSGLMFAQGGRHDRAFALWRALLEEGPADAPWVIRIRAGIEDEAYLAGVNYTLPDSTLPGAPGPDAGDIAAAGDMAPEERQAMIEAMVAQLSDRLASDGGPVEDWARLIRSLAVLERTEAAQAIYDEARTRFAGREGELSFLRLAAVEAGLAP